MLELDKDRDFLSGDAVKTSFDFDFYIQRDTDIEIHIVNEDTEVSTKLDLTTDYTITNILSQGSYGFTVNFVSYVPTVDECVLAIRKMPITQVLDLAAVTDFDERKMMSSLDKLTAIAQQNSHRIDLCLHYPETDTNTYDTEFPVPEASRGVKWDPTGTYLINSIYDPDTGDATCIGRPDITDASDFGDTYDYTTLQAAITAIGLNQKALYLRAGSWVIDNNITFPANVMLLMAIGARMDVATGVTVTINGPIDASLLQIFNCVGTGKVLFDGRSTTKVYPQWFGAVGDAATDDLAAFKKAVEACVWESWLEIPQASYYLSAQLDLARFTNGNGSYFINGGVRVTNVDRAIVRNFYTTNIILSGLKFSKIEDIKINQTGGLIIGEAAVAVGFAWNTIKNVHIENVGVFGSVGLVLNNTGAYINENIFENIKSSGDTTHYGLKLTGVSSHDMHSNSFSNCDFSGTKGVINDLLDDGQVNMLSNVYMESGAKIIGKFNIVGIALDTLGQSGGDIGNRCHILGSNDNNERASNDFIAIGSRNLIKGGEWDRLNSGGYPAGFGANIVAASAVADATEPSGSGYKYGGVSAASGAYIYMNIDAVISGKVGIAFYFKGDVPDAIDLTRSGSTTSYNTLSATFIDVGNGWRLVRISGLADTTTNTTALKLWYNIDGHTTSREFYIGGAFASASKACPLPICQKQFKNENGTLFLKGKLIESGSISQTYTASSPATISVTFPKAFSAAPVVTANVYQDTNTYDGNFKSIELKNITTTGFQAKIYFATGYAGILQWMAKGAE